MKETLQKPEYGKTVASELRFDDAVRRAKDALKDEGFGVLCEIDVRKTLREKLSAEFRPYTILGACNPSLAHAALLTDAYLGLLLPCNVVVQEENGHVTVSAIDAAAMLSVAHNPALLPIAQDVNSRLERVLDRLVS